jgi:hypothetical protein
MIDIEKYRLLLGKRKTAKDWQPTQHQQDAVETAELFDDIKSLGIYLAIFKRYALDRLKLLRAREWVSRKGTGEKGRLFVSVYKKFVEDKPYKAKY